MAIVSCNPLVLAPTPLADINVRLVAHFVEQYRAGNTLLGEGAEAVAKAAIALQEAYARKDYQISTVDNYDESEIEADKNAYERAINSINAGFPKRGVMWGVARHQLPRSTSPGEYITIHYKFLNEIATAAGLVITEHNYPQGKGVVIKLMETNNGFNLGKNGWRYAALWIPCDRSGMAGFLF